MAAPSYYAAVRKPHWHATFRHSQTHVFLLALINKWVFLMEWPGHSTAFASPFGNYTYDASVADGRTTAELSFMGCPERHDSTSVGCPLNLGDARRRRDFEADVTFVRINRGGLRWGGARSRDSLRAMGLEDANRAGA